MRDGVGALPDGHIKRLEMLVLHTKTIRWNWVVPFGFALILTFFIGCFFLERRKDNLLKSKSYTATIILVVMACLGGQCVTWLVYAGHIDASLADNFGLLGSVGIMVVIGNYLSTARKSWFSGVPMPWAMKSDLAWAKMHRLLGRGFTLISMCLGVSFFVFENNLLSIQLWFVAFAALLIVATLYARKIWQNDPNREEFGRRKI